MLLHKSRNFFIATDGVVTVAYIFLHNIIRAYVPESLVWIIRGRYPLSLRQELATVIANAAARYAQPVPNYPNDFEDAEVTG
jgi:hypothetical protein